MAHGEAEIALKKLEDLEREELKKKQELEKLKQKIKNATSQIRSEKELEEKVPIDQVAKLSEEGLSAPEKEILRTHKGKKKDAQDSTDSNESLESKATKTKEISLEATVQSEAVGGPAVRIPAETELAMQYQQQIVGMSREPITQLYSEMKNVYESSSEAGYVSADRAQHAVELQSAIERKLADVEAGNYAFTSDQTAKAASVALSMKDKVSAMYVAGKDNSPGNDLYK